MEPSDREHLQKELWKSQEDDEMDITSDEIRAKAYQHERHSVRVYWVLITITPPFIAAFVHNLIYFRDPWLRFGAIWAVAAFCYIVWHLIRKRPTRIQPAEPCAQYLRREYATKRDGLVWVRRAVLLFFPAVVATWFGGGPLLRAKSLGITSPFVLHMLGGPAPLIGMALILALVWFAFSHELRKLDREIETLRRE